MMIGVLQVQRRATKSLLLILVRLIRSTDELKDLKKDVSSIKSAMNEIFQIVEKETITKELTSEETNKRFKELEKIVLRFFTIFLNLKNIYIG